jgi:ABC-type Fe3+-hydroxamate transport system substrate-binding protein
VQTYIDQMGYAICLPTPPTRIISLVPSQTELLVDLGLEETIVGITRYCIHPKEKVKRFKANNLIVGGTKKLNIALIRKLKPDLIIGNKEENEQSQMVELKKEFPVWMSDIQTLEEAYQMIEHVGALVSKKEKALELVRHIKKEFEKLIPIKETKTALYLIWRKPFIGVGKDTFIHHLMETCGFRNVLATHRYPELNIEIIALLHPHYIFLSSEPYPFKEKHIQELQTICPHSKIRLVDGEQFSWYGSRLLYFTRYFQSLQSLL